MSTPDRTGVRSIAAAVRADEVEPRWFVEESLRRIRAAESGDGSLHAFLSVAEDPEDAERDEAGSTGRREGRLAGVPVAVKDNLATLELPTTCASRILEGYRSPFEATAVRNARRAGAVVVGKTNLDEFAMGSSTENSAFGPTRNPHDPSRVPGGSSGGSAAAVAAGLVPAALGSDTGGSVRQPAAFCGVVGVKPTYGRVSRYGLVAFASSLDQVGTLGRTVEDAALLLEAVSGHDPRDSTSADRPVPGFGEVVGRGVEGLTVGLPREYFPPELDEDVAARCREAADLLADAGADVREVSLPHTDAAIPTYYVLATAEASSNLARYDGVRYGRRASGARSTREVYERSRSEGFGAEVKRRILLGTYVLSSGYYEAYYGRAQAVRRRITREFGTCFDGGVDVLLTPTTPTPAFPLGERVEDPYAMYLSDVFTVTANLAGLPAVSVPVGRARDLPVGAQLIARPWHEEDALRAAGCIERARGPETVAPATPGGGSS